MLEGKGVCVCVCLCVCVCDGVVAVVVVAVKVSETEGGGCRTHREPKTGRILLQVSFLYPSSSHCFTPSPSQMNKTDLALSPHPTPSKSIC